ncbi:hypothetical protein NE237_007970 [Protea cynaroides]|uniref:Disease resistance N-terminal domain-containing protein n=1 Tax=Protea cynaroides TaxID=273540 RepID=A0A9Q0KR87_9MAGN|nr:hypothetical protein NE237_007970 [Protea cynaroides]
MIQAVLQDAEMREVKGRTVRPWMKMLKDVAYGVLDEFLFESMRQRMAIQNRVMNKQKSERESGDQRVWEHQWSAEEEQFQVLFSESAALRASSLFECLISHLQLATKIA